MIPRAVVTEPAPRSAEASPDRAELQAREMAASPATDFAGWRPESPAALATAPAVASAGEPMRAELREPAERRFGADLSRVRFHRDPVAERFAEEQGANAVTLGEHVYFGRGQYSPGTADGDRLVAHELVHTVQQRRAGILGLQRDDKKKGKKAGAKKPDPTANMTDAQKAEIRQEVERTIDSATESYLAKIDQRPALNALDADQKAKLDAMKAMFKESKAGAAKAKDPTDRATRVALLDAAIAATADKYFVYGVLDGVISINSLSVGKIGNPDYATDAETLKLWQGETAILQGGGRTAVKVQFAGAVWEQVEKEYGVTKEMLKTEDQTEEEQKASGGTGLTVEDKQRLREVYEAIPPDQEGGDVVDPQVLAEKLRDLSPADLEQFKEFLKQRPKTPDEEVPPFEEMLEQFKKLSPAERDTLLANAELNAASPTPAKLDGKVLLDLTKGDSEMTAAASQIDSNMALIASLVTDKDKMKGHQPIGIDIGLFELEMAFFRGFLGGGAARSDLVRGAVTDLTAALAQAQREMQEELLAEAVVTGALALVPVIGEAKLAATLARLEILRRKIDKIRKAYAIVDQIRSFLDFVASIPDIIEEFRAFMERAELAYTTFVPMLQELEDSPELDEKIAKVEDEIIEKFDELLEGKMGDILEMFYIAPDTSAEDLVRIIYDLPKGFSALETAWEFYSSTDSSDPQAAERVLIRSAKAGALMYPVVGFIAAFAAEKIGAAFPDLGILDRVVGKLTSYSKDKKKRKESNRGSFFRLNKSNYDYNESDLLPYLEKGSRRLREMLEEDEPGQHWVGSWLRVSIRDKLDDLNREFAKETVTAKVKERRPASGKKKATKVATTRTEKVPLPPFRVKFPRIDGDPKHETVELSLNPHRKDLYDTLTNDDFKTPEGVPLEVKGRSKRVKALRKWLDDHDYQLIADENAKPHIRLRDGISDSGTRVYLRIDNSVAPAVLRYGIHKEDYLGFIGRHVNDSRDLPEGFYLKADSSGAIVSRKRGVRKDQEAPALGLDADGKLVEGGRSQLGPSTIAPVGVTKPDGADLETYGWQAALKKTLSGGDYDAQGGTSSTWDRRVANTKWGDMKKRPKRVSGEVGYVLRARAFGDSLGSIYPPELKTSDDKGHLIAKRFGGDDHLNNIIPMKRSVNQFPGKWYDLEGDMAKVYTGKTATPGHRLWLSIEIDYPGSDTRRPSRFHVEWKELAGSGGSPIAGKGSGRKLSISNG